MANKIEPDITVTQEMIEAGQHALNSPTLDDDPFEIVDLHEAKLAAIYLAMKAARTPEQKREEVRPYLMSALDRLAQLLKVNWRHDQNSEIAKHED